MYCRARNIGGEFNLMDWQLKIKPPNLKLPKMFISGIPMQKNATFFTANIPSYTVHELHYLLGVLHITATPLFHYCHAPTSLCSGTCSSIIVVVGGSITVI